ncbi:uroporphyrinogen-III synthase [Microbulbifer sp. OS29]|uniref:Uroporphyrinogen-III synthase n=1 Tax=Microbulbifer okhotskensis TaxID=2926617 RepID=A0A9X2ENR0_9GAMM|nr:uroporphyrinogen-III synthase [Microbulbifer okhotskensis]MCO1332988.1 uroporphyrinogen-III synthase [Microbulbifer okhotskensis]
MDKVLPDLLRSKRILSTRPTQQSASWCVFLRDSGALVDNIPMLAIAPLEDDESTQAIKKSILDFDLVDKAIFVSQNAVRYGLDWLDSYWPQLPKGPRFLAIGAATARALEDCGIPCEQSGISMNSEELLLLPGLQQLNGQRILIFRGLGGRTLIGDTLRKRGGRVNYCELYRRILPQEAADSLAQYGFQPDAICVHSGETLTNLTFCIHQTGQSTLFQTPLVCPSVRVAKLAGELGFTACHAALNAGDSAMLEALRKAVC